MDNSLDIAIIGMSGRFPGAKTVEEFWQNLAAGKEAVSFFTKGEIEQRGARKVDLDDPTCVKAAAILGDADLFDASFFGFYPREAELMDPQHRLFLEECWQALESGGYNPESYKGLIGVYAGVGINTYLMNNILPNAELLKSLDPSLYLLHNDKDSLSTIISYKLNLRGPSITIQTSCSTSLVAVHLACQGLLDYSCDMALAGGVAIHVPEVRCYSYRQGGILSTDGHCRAFDKDASGTVGGSGVGVVVLKRLREALDDRDHIHAVIKGSAINNDGSLKVGYTAPSIDGQSQVIRAAQAIAEVEADTITYVEAHGTGTALGDPIEMAALTQAFQTSTKKKGFCAIGSVKTNIGHLDAAAGIAGLIKTVLALEQKLIPPSLHFKEPNPDIDFDNSPFCVNTQLSEWKSSNTPRRAGVSSFGMGGTNAHVIVEEAPSVEASPARQAWHLLLLSAKSDSSLEAATGNLLRHLQQHSDIELADVSYTLQVGRKAFPRRRAILCEGREDAIRVLEGKDPTRTFSGAEMKNRPNVAFMFPGQAAQYVNMGRDLYEREPRFRFQIDHCSESLKPHLGTDLRDILYPGDEQQRASTHGLDQTFITQPALFVVEYALARLWMEWGIHPQAMIGHSVGEYVAACLAGVFSLEDALQIIALRGKLMQQLPPGAMLSVPLSARDVEPLLGDALSVAAINSPSKCVVSGDIQAAMELKRLLAERGLSARIIPASHAFHSRMMEPVIEPFRLAMSKIKLHEPAAPYISNVTGTWVEANDAIDPSYWAAHLRSPVMFSKGVQELLNTPDLITLEVGPGNTLSALLRQHCADKASPTVIASMRHPHEMQSDEAVLLAALGKVWLAGAQVNWDGVDAVALRRRVPLPTYPFQRARYWISPPPEAESVGGPATLSKKLEVDEWCYVPSWTQSLPLICDLDKIAQKKRRWLILLDQCGIGSRLAERLQQNNQDVVVVLKGDRFEKLNGPTYSISPDQKEDYALLLNDLDSEGRLPDEIIHLWSVTEDNNPSAGVKQLQSAQSLGLNSLLFLIQALNEKRFIGQLRVRVVSNNAQPVTGEEMLQPEKTTILGLCKVAPQEYANITCGSIDISLPKSAARRQIVADRVFAEVTADKVEPTVAHRGNTRWVQTFQHLPLDGYSSRSVVPAEGGVYLITGGLGDVGLALAECLASNARVKLVLVNRSGLPPEGEWDELLAASSTDETTREKIKRVRAFEASGSQVLICKADVSNREEMKAAIDKALNRFGPLSGVIHAAGLVGEEWLKPIAKTDCDEIALHFRPKVYGLLVLESLLRDTRLDFFILVSSLSSILGGFGYAAYSSANIFMDTFAQSQRLRNGLQCLSIDWDGWQPQYGKAIGKSKSKSPDLSITPEEGMKVFRLLLQQRERLSQVAVSTTPLETRIKQWIERTRIQPGVAAEGRAQNAPIAQAGENPVSDSAPPENETEHAIARLWREALGVAEVRADDDFFELGGDSLLATQVISQLRQQFQVEVPLRRFFERPTVRALSEVIGAIQQEKELDRQLEILDMLERLSEDEIDVELLRGGTTPEGRA